MTEPYLQHYGVLGMKWGVRKAESEGKKYSSRRTQKYRDAAAKATNAKDARKYNTLAKRSQQLDDNRAKYAKKSSNLAAYAQTGYVGVNLAKSARGIATAAKTYKVAKTAGMAAMAGPQLAAGVGAALVAQALSTSVIHGYSVHRSYGDGRVTAALKSVAGLGVPGAVLRDQMYIGRGYKRGN